jgi:phosphoglycerate dehydrogenase-like enzyme
MNERMRIAILDDYQDAALESADWSKVGDAVELRVIREVLSSEDSVADRISDCQVVVAMRERTPFPATLLERLPALQLLVTTGRSNDSIDVAAAARRGIVVCGTRAASAATATAELAWGLLLAVARRIAVEDTSVRSDGWQTTVGAELDGRRLGLIGLGRVGARVARYGHAFGMDVVAWSQNLTDEHASTLGVRRVTKDELLSSSDVISLHLRLGDRSRALIGAPEFDAMRTSAILINTSRGPIVDEPALVAALHERRIGGAGLDVYDEEPLPPGHPLCAAPGTVLTPHLGFVTKETYDVFYQDAVEDIICWIDGQPIRILSA